MMRSDGRAGFTLIELLIVVALIGILAGIVAPFLMQAKRSANEASAIGTLRAINSAQSAYAASCARSFYTTSLLTLANGRFIGPEANMTPKSGFNFALATGAAGVAGPADCNGDPTMNAYYVVGTPVSSMSGRRAFATSEGATIWQDQAGVPPPQPFVSGGTIGPLQSQ